MQKSTAALASVVLDVVQHPATSITSFRPLPPSPLRAQSVRGSVCTQSSLAPISWAQPSRGTVGLSLGFGISATQSPTKAAPRPTQRSSFASPVGQPAREMSGPSSAFQSPPSHS